MRTLSDVALLSVCVLYLLFGPSQQAVNSLLLARLPDNALSEK